MQRFKNILLVLGRSGFSGNAARNALHLAQLNKARLSAVEVVPTTGDGYGFGRASAEKHKVISQMLREERQKEIEESYAEAAIDVNVTIKVLSGKEFIEIIRHVQKERIDLVIKEVEEEKRLASMFFGSTDLRLLRKCPCPVWLVNSDSAAKNPKIMAAVELESIDDRGQLDELNQKIIEIATSLAYREGSDLHIVNAWIVFEGTKLAQKLSRQYREDIADWVADQRDSIEKAQAAFKNIFESYLEEQGLQGLDYTFHFVEGVAEEVITDLAKGLDIDVVVMGTVARTDLAGVLVGNTSEAILNQIDSSVLAIKPPGFVSPVTLENG